jgi:hypothetical protein
LVTTALFCKPFLKLLKILTWKHSFAFTIGETCIAALILLLYKEKPANEAVRLHYWGQAFIYPAIFLPRQESVQWVIVIAFTRAPDEFAREAAAPTRPAAATEAATTRTPSHDDIPNIELDTASQAQGAVTTSTTSPQPPSIHTKFHIDHGRRMYADSHHVSGAGEKLMVRKRQPYSMV